MQLCHLTRPLLSLSFIVIIFAGGLTMPRADGSTAGNTTKLIGKLEHIRQRQNVPALALVLVRDDGGQSCHVRGVRDRLSRQAATPETQFRIGSITKTFTSLALLQLQEQGRLGLNDPVRRHAPDAPIDNPWHTSNPIRVAHLLEHTAGLLDLTRAEFDNNDPTPLSLKAGLFFTNKSRRSMWPPGLHSSYSNAGAGYAAYVLEKVTGQKFESYVVEKIFKPLQMYEAGLFLDARTRKALATGYDSDGKTVIPYWHQTLRAYGAINTTPCDMGNLLRMLLDNGYFNDKQIVTAASVRRMERPRTTLAANSGLEYGYGLANYQYVHEGFVFHGHGGDGDGYLAHFAYSRDVNAGYFLVINAFNKDALTELRDQVESFLVAGKSPSTQQEMPLSDHAMQALSGRYVAATHRFVWDKPTAKKPDSLLVGVENGRLYTQFPDRRRVPLYAVNKHHFRRFADPLATVAFIKHDGKLYLQGDFGNYRRVGDIVKKSSDS